MGTENFKKVDRCRKHNSSPDFFKNIRIWEPCQKIDLWFQGNIQISRESAPRPFSVAPGRERPRNVSAGPQSTRPVVLWQFLAFCMHRIPGKFQGSFVKESKSGVSHDLRQKQHWCNVTVGGPWASRRACWVKRLSREAHVPAEENAYTWNKRLSREAHVPLRNTNIPTERVDEPR